MNKGIKKALDLFGNQKEMAKQLGVKQQAISLWLTEKQKASVKNAIQIEKATFGLVSRSEIRGDIFGDAA